MSIQQCSVIVVDYVVLGDSLTSLGSIRRDFEETTKHTNDLLDHLGQYQLADAMRQFSANWDRARDDLVVRVKETEGAVKKVMASFSEQDRQAAKLFNLSVKPVHQMTTKETA